MFDKVTCALGWFECRYLGAVNRFINILTRYGLEFDDIFHIVDRRIHSFPIEENWFNGYIGEAHSFHHADIFFPIHCASDTAGPGTETLANRFGQLTSVTISETASLPPGFMTRKASLKTFSL